MPQNKWTSAEHAHEYLGRADSIPHRTEGEATLLEALPPHPHRILDLGTGDGRLLALVKKRHPEAEAVGLDFSPTMLERAQQRFARDRSVRIVTHNMDHPLPELGHFDAVVSSFAIHHLAHDRKRSLYSEIGRMLESGGVFCNLERVTSPTVRLHEEFLTYLGIAPKDEDPSNQLLDMETQLQWLREIGFIDVDCLWKWRELALMVGRRK